MPKCLEPGGRFPIVLDSDKNKPEESRPTFFVPALSAREQNKFATDCDSIDGLSINEIHDKRADLLGDTLVDWGNMTDRDGNEIPFDREKLLDVVDRQDILELCRKIYLNDHVPPEEKKS